MNTRIWELFAKSGIDISEDQEMGIEKFAELIVAECAAVCLKQRDPHTLNYKPSIKFADAVKSHFGVK